MQEIIIIAAMAENRVIGRNNALPWSLKEDMAHFKQLTKGNPCIMGRKTWESLPKKPLPERLNIVISQVLSSEANASKTGQEVKIFTSLQEAVQYCAGYEKIFICGGESIYRQALEIADKIELTIIHSQYEGDAYFPEIDSACWKITNAVHFDTFSFLTYSKKWRLS